MTRLLAAMLAIVGLLAMAPVVHASGLAMGRGVVAHGGTATFMTDGSDAPCVGGTPCVLACVACLPALAGRAVDGVPAEAETNAGTLRLGSFDLYWRLYRPPKGRMRRSDDQRPPQHKGNQDA